MRKIEPGRERRRITNRSIVLIVFMLAGVMLGLANTSRWARADDSVGSVSQITGKAQIERGGATIDARQGTPLKLHDKVTTQPNSSATLGFGDGSSIALGSGTSIAIEDSTTLNGQTIPSRVTLISGNIHTIVPDKTTGQSHSIEVDTPSVRVTGPSPSR